VNLDVHVRIDNVRPAALNFYDSNENELRAQHQNNQEEKDKEIQSAGFLVNVK